MPRIDGPHDSIEQADMVKNMSKTYNGGLGLGSANRMSSTWLNSSQKFSPTMDNKGKQ